MKNNYLLIFLLFITTLLHAQTVQLEDHWWTPNGDVYTVVKDGNTVYLGGNFTFFGPSIPNGASISTTTGQPDMSFVKPNGIVVATVPDGAGGWYIGGQFTAIAGQTRNRIARINSDGSLHPWNPNADNIVRTLAVSGTTVYVGGDFTNIGGQSRNYIAAIDTTTGLATTWNPNASSYIYALAVNATTVYAGGYFASIGGQTRNRIAEIDATTGLATAWNPNSNNYIVSLFLNGTTLYAGGAFSSIGGQTRNRIAALNTATGLATAWDPNPNNIVNTILVYGATVYAGGNFTAIGGQTRNRIAALDATTGLATAWDANANGTVRALVLNGTTLYAGGDFTAVGGQTKNSIAALDITTGLATAWEANANYPVRTLAVNGTSIYAGGDFTVIGAGLTRNRIAALDATTGQPTAWNPNASSSILSILVDGTTVYAGGGFTNIGGQIRNRIAALDATTGLATAWNPNASSNVRTIAVNGGTVYAGGDFTTIGGQSRNYIAALDATTGLVSSWNPGANNTVNTIVVDGATVYAGGYFSTIGGQTRNYIAALDNTTGLASSWNPNANNIINTIVISGTTVYVGGSLFNTIGGQARNGIAAIDATTGLATSWNPNANGGVRTIALNGSTVYVGGDFTTIAGQSRNRIAAIDATTGLATAWNPDANNTVWKIFVDGGKIYTGGFFSSIKGVTRKGFAVFNSCTLTASAGSQTNVLCHGAATGEATVTTTNGSAPYTYSWNTTPVQTTATATGLAAGTYVVTVTDAGNCTATQSFTITEPATALTATAGAQTNILCHGNATGGATVNATGGTGAYTYSWELQGTPVAYCNSDLNSASFESISNVAFAGINNTSGANDGAPVNYTAQVAHVTAGNSYPVSVTINDGGGDYINAFIDWNQNGVLNDAGEVYTIAANVSSPGPFTINVNVPANAVSGNTRMRVMLEWNNSAPDPCRIALFGEAEDYTVNVTASFNNGTNTISGVPAGTYIATVTDANNCTATQSFTITEPIVLTASAGTQTNVLCHGNATGEATVTATGGNGAYTYSWNTTPVQTTATATDLEAGTYVATVTDANNCTATQSFTITEPATALTASAGTQVDVLCHGNATGEATVTATGGTGAYTYSWNTTPVQTTATATTLLAGTYIATVTDANNCTATQSFTITEPATALTATAGAQTNVLCYGNATGEATVTATGGTGVYTYSWNTIPVQTTATATALTAGTYVATVTDANNCTATQSFTITEPAAAMTFTPNTSQTDVLCNGQATGAATVAVNGGTGAYTYLWSNGGNTNTITGLTAGIYTVDVTDANGCILNNSFTITEPTALVATAGAQTDVLCFGNATGEATVNVTGGTGAYTYSWNTTPVQTTATATGLTAGTYIATVTDANLCTTTQSFTITEPAILVVSAGPQNNVLCNGNTTGTAYVNANGGVGPYSYSWDTTPVQTTDLAIGLAAGTYIATVTDGNGCQGTQSFTITEPSVLTATAGAQTNVLCFGNATGEATINATGGAGAYTYSWDTTPVQTTATATGLAAGTYTVTVYDANQCQTTQQFTITQPAAAMVFTPNTTQTDVLCNGQATGSATVAVNGGTGAYTYLWSNGGTTNTITNVIAGTYTVDVTDANGCTLSNSFTITQPSALVATAGAQTNVLCYGNTTGTATVNVTGGTGAYSYSWNTNPVQTTATATGLAAGNYTVTVYDANQCQTTRAFTITQPSQPLSTTPNTSQTNVSCFGGANGTATIAVTGGTSSYTYLWSNGQTTAVATGLIAGTYSVTVTDANGCTLSNSFTITQPTALVATAGPQTNVTCFGAANGSATVNATGGTGAYTYSWNTAPVQTTATATGLAPGNYTVTVYDANQCQTTQTFIITQPQQLAAAINNYTNILCYGAATGSASTNVSGGTQPYSYLWNTGQTTPVATGLTAGSYSVIVTDANGCQANATVTITQPASPLVATAGPQTNLLCFGNTNGSATVNVTGGTGAYTYSWNTTPVQTTATATGLAAGTYTVTVYDTNQCQTTRTFIITQPAAVTGYFTVVHSDCHATGSAIIHGAGGVAPYTYLWSDGGTTPNLQNALPGTYTVTITDANGCFNVLSTTINGTVPIVITSAPQAVTINGGETAVFTVEAQNAVFYQWQVSTNGGTTFTNLNAGGSMPTYYGVATPTLTVANAYSFIDGYQYRVILMQQSGCYIVSEAAELTVNAPVAGIGDMKHLDMSIYPNPASTEVFVKIPDFASYQNIKVMMYDLNGRLVRNESPITSEDYSMDVSGLESGVYIITITTDTARIDKKLIVTKKP